MLKLGIAIQGMTFMKSMIPLAIFANSVGVLPVLLLYRFRKGKTHDNLDHDRVYEIMKGMDLKFEAFIVSDENDALRIMRKEKISNVVCQDAQHHGKVFCKTHGLNVFSIGVFFDTLHYANRLRRNHLKYEAEPRPDVLYFPDARFRDDFFRLFPDYDVRHKSIGSPLYDHSLFVEKKEYERSVLFLCGLQDRLSKTLQRDLESFAKHCIENNITFYMKTRPKTPWKFQDSFVTDNVKVIRDEAGFPSTSLDMILNTDLHISSYSTSVIESGHFGKPCINLDTIHKKGAEYGFAAVKDDFNFHDVYNSQLCKTVNEKVQDAYYSFVSDNRKAPPIESITFSSNNSKRILEDLVSFASRK